MARTSDPRPGGRSRPGGGAPRGRPVAAARGPERTRRALTSAALELFAARGYDATTVDAIVERAGVSRRTFFNHFSKEDVLFAIDPLWLSQLQELITSRPAHEHDLDAVVQAHVRWLTTSEDVALRRRRARLLRQAASSSSTLLGREYSQHRANIAAVADAVARRGGRASA